MTGDTITIDRDLFDRLVECAVELEALKRWQKDEPRRGYRDLHGEIETTLRESVAIQYRTRNSGC